MGTSEIDLDKAERIIGYRFRGRQLLAEALHSPIRDRDDLTGEVTVRDNNRRLARLGQTVLEMVLVCEWFHDDRVLSFEQLDDVKKTWTLRPAVAAMAEQSTLVSCIYMSRRQRGMAVPPTTLQLCLLAILAAVWLDSDENLAQVQTVCRNLGFALLTSGTTHSDTPRFLDWSSREVD